MVKRDHYASHDQLWERLGAFLDVRRLKTLCEALCHTGLPAEPWLTTGQLHIRSDHLTW